MNVFEVDDCNGKLPTKSERLAGMLCGCPLHLPYLRGILIFNSSGGWKTWEGVLNYLGGYLGNQVTEVFEEVVMAVLFKIPSECILSVKFLVCGEFSGEGAKLFCTPGGVRLAVYVIQSSFPCVFVLEECFYLGILSVMLLVMTVTLLTTYFFSCFNPMEKFLHKVSEQVQSCRGRHFLNCLLFSTLLRCSSFRVLERLVGLGANFRNSPL